MTSTSQSMILFDDVFEVDEVDGDGKKFTRVSRVKCRSQKFVVDLVLDVHSDLLPLKAKDSFNVLLASTLALDGAGDTGSYDQSRGETLADEYEYVMFGKVFKYVDDGGGALSVSVHVSFGGLLMQLTGEPKYLDEIRMDQDLYLLINRN